MVSFEVSDEEELAKLPRLEAPEGDTGEEGGVVFFFDNQDEARNAFGPPGSTGEATIVVENYVIERYPSDGAYDPAELVDVEEQTAG